MANDIEPLILDLVEWVAKEPRPYDELMSVWRTSCPRLPVWEEAVERGYVVQSAAPGRGMLVAATASGHRLLSERGRAAKGAVPCPMPPIPVTPARNIC
jgi:hypothetical protein